MFKGLPARFGCSTEKNPNRAFEKFVTRLVMETLSLSGKCVRPAPVDAFKDGKRPL